jgi:hypothetical protein
VEYVCPFCDKTTAKKFGLRNHLKGCKKIPVGANVDNAYDKAVKYTDDNIIDENGIDEYDYESGMDMEDTDRDRNIQRNTQRDKQTSGLSGLIGAFTVMSDHIPILIDINFAIALGDHILENGSDNKAILAFGHQLKKLDD